MSALSAERALEILYPSLLDSLEAGSGGPFVAGVLLEGQIVGRGTNTVLRDHDVTRHAEMNALSGAGRSTGRIRLEGAQLVTSHFPCLMCYHAVKWAGIRSLLFVFDYAETEAIFGFRGDSRFTADLGLATRAWEHDATLSVSRVSGPRIDELYRKDLPRRWESCYRARCGGYDV
jgi:tRNA(Arg) A34 adenosine deaminase TadA